MKRNDDRYQSHRRHKSDIIPFMSEPTIQWKQRKKLGQKIQITENISQDYDDEFCDDARNNIDLEEEDDRRLENIAFSYLSNAQK